MKSGSVIEGSNGPSSRRIYLTLSAIVALVAIPRLAGLTSLPMHYDEAVYTGWGLRIVHLESPLDLLYSVTDGKQPLFAWLIAPFLAIVPDRLFAARLASVCLGILSSLLLFAIARRLLGPRTATVSAVLYVVSPQTVFYDRMALYDSLLLTTSLATLLAVLRWVDRPLLTRMVVVGFCMGLGMLTKLSATFYMGAAIIVAAILLPRVQRTRLWQFAVAYLIAGGMFSVIYAHPLHKNVLEGNGRYALRIVELIALPFDQWLSNAKVYLIQAPAIYLTVPVLALAGAGALLLLFTGRRGSALLSWSFIPLALLILTARLQFTRYELFAIAPFLILAAYACVRLYDAVFGRVALRSAAPRGLRWGLTCLAAAVILVPSLTFDALLIVDPARAPLGDVGISDRSQYVERHPSGYGLAEVSNILIDHAASNPVVVTSWCTTGSWDMNFANLAYREGIQVGCMSTDESVSGHVSRLKADDPRRRTLIDGATMFVLLNEDVGSESERAFLSANPGARLVAEYLKPGGKSHTCLYRFDAESLRLGQKP